MPVILMVLTALAADLGQWTRSRTRWARGRLQELETVLQRLRVVPQDLDELERRLKTMETARKLARTAQELARTAQAAELAELRRLLEAQPQRAEVLERADPLVAFLQAEITAEARRQDLIQHREDSGAEVSIVADPEWQRLWKLRQDALRAARVPPAPIDRDSGA